MSRSLWLRLPRYSPYESRCQTSLYDSNPTSRSVADPVKSVNHFECGDISTHFKRFCRNSCVRYRQPPMKWNFFCLAMLLTLVCTMFASQPSPSTSDGDFDVIIRNGTV